MNLFVVGWGLPDATVEHLQVALADTASAYPQLRDGARWSHTSEGGVFVGTVSTPEPVASPRSYLVESPDGALFFDGLPLDPSGGIAAHRAAELDRHWDRLPEVLEGRFAIMRLRTAPVPTIELLTDPLGVVALYVVDRGAWGLISNRVRPIERVARATEPDPLAMGHLLSLGWVGGNRTLRRDISVIPGGQQWTWRQGRGWDRRTYYSVRSAARSTGDRLDRGLVDEVATSLVDVSRAAASITGSVFSPLSGGRDSRMLAGALIAGGVPARFWTKGDPGTLDVVIAGRIAERYGLDHRIAHRPISPPTDHDLTHDVLADFERLAWQLVDRTDGMASLYMVQNIVGQPEHIDRLAVTLSGLGGEVTRCRYNTPFVIAPGASARRLLHALPTLMVNHWGGLLRPRAVRSARDHVVDFLTGCLDDGIPVANLPDMVYSMELQRRTNMTNPPEHAPVEDKVLVFHHRRYFEAPFQVLPIQRSSKQLSRALIARLVPGLEIEPPFDTPWPGPPVPLGRRAIVRATVGAYLPDGVRPAFATARRVLTRHRPSGSTPLVPYEPAAWLEAHRERIREVTLSQQDWAGWQVVDRAGWERLMSPSTTTEERTRYRLPLLAFGALAFHEELRRRELG